MTSDQLAAVADLLADGSRAAICLALLDGRSWTVGELARHAGVAPSTASEHVARLTGGGILAVVRQGRHRYVRLADSRTAQLIEDLAAYATLPAFAALPDSAGQSAARPHSLRAASAADALVRARTCYDHLAGRLGVRLTDAMTGIGLIDQAFGFALTEAGLAWLNTELGVDVAAMTSARRPVARSCLDWTERRPHLGGAAGAAVCERFFARGWIYRVGTARAVKVTVAGQGALHRLLGVDVTAAAA
ncbi:MAG TPA: winged helix-turn-helix domain-containing protein [Streptosporangiaceae bacterium]|nr:winged helix-turn-helix domain-containing protein [Streptosporangiaceae bacterium]